MPFATTGIAFEVAARSRPRNPARSSQVAIPGVSTSSGASSASGKLGRARHAVGDLGVGRVVAALAGDERVLARARGSEKVERLAAPHHPRLGLHADGLELAAVEDPLVGPLVRLERAVEALFVAVERVRVLHHELADAQQAAARTLLVPLLRLEVVEDLREVAVRAELAHVERDRLLVRRGEHELPLRAVAQLHEHVEGVVAAASLPELSRRQDRHRHLLSADRVHLLADDLHDLLVHAPAGGKVRPETGADLPDQPGPHEQLVRDGLGVGRVLAQRREEER